MGITPSSDKPFRKRLVEQLSSYSVVGVTTFILDLALLSVLLFMFDITQPFAIGAAFLIAVHINYISLNFWTYKHSLERVSRTYLYFIVVALTLSFLIPVLVIWLSETFEYEIMTMRIIVGAIIGILSFFFNSFLNFKHL